MTSTASSGGLQSVVDAQLASLDDTDTYASAWSEALANATARASTAGEDGDGKLRSFWGGRGKGGRALARRTVQPFDVVVDDVCLEYVGGGTGSTSKSSRSLLDGATLKLLSRKVYALAGRNGCGKSTLLRRIHAGRIPGFPPHLRTLYIPQEVAYGRASGRTALSEVGKNDDDDIDEAMLTPVDVLIWKEKENRERTEEASKLKINDLEAELESLDVQSEEDQEQIEKICEQISTLEDALQADDGGDRGRQVGGDNPQHVRAVEALESFGIDDTIRKQPMHELSGGQRKKVILASAIFEKYDILLLDEPTNHLDVEGILQLRNLIHSCEERNITCVLVSHDVDLINDVATDTIHMSQQRLCYYPGNYGHFVEYKRQNDLHQLRQGNTLEKQRKAIITSMDNIKKHSAGMKGDGNKKTAKQIESRKKKLERHGVEKDPHGHRWTAQTHGGIREGAINSVDASNRKNMKYGQLLKQAETNVAPVPDKEIQFKFPDPKSTWGGKAMINAMDVGHGYDVIGSSPSGGEGNKEGSFSLDDNEASGSYPEIQKKDGLLFDCVDLCIQDGSRTCILGANGGGKSTLLKVLAGELKPVEGTVNFAHNVCVCNFDQHVTDDLIDDAHATFTSGGGKRNMVVTPLSMLREMFPGKNEQDVRGELTAFGLGPQQALTNVRFLSGGERARLCLAALFLRDPDVLLMDEPSNHLDPESVEALAYGLARWKGTLVMVSHDSNLIREVGGACYVLMEREGKLRRIEGGIDTYLKAFFVR